VRTRTKQAPKLTAQLIADDGALHDTIPGALETPGLQPYTDEVLRLQARLRDLLLSEVERWKAYLALEEAVNDRIAAESIALVRWAWREGRRVGRRQARSGR
jgi:hypothetical protein